MVPAAFILVLVYQLIKGTMLMPLDHRPNVSLRMDMPPSSYVKKMQTNREELIFVLCALTKRFTTSDIDFKRFQQRRYSNAPSEADIDGITDEVRLRRLDVLSCCKNSIAPTAGQNRNTKKNDASLCLNHVRRRRVDLLCSRDNHSVPFTLHGRSFMNHKILNCCFKLGVPRYTCFANDSLKKTDSSAEYFSLDETDPVNDVWDFPMISSQIQKLTERDAASSVDRLETRQQKRRGITNTNNNTTREDATSSKRTYDTFNVECACKLQGQDRVTTGVDSQSVDERASEAGTITTPSLDIQDKRGDEGLKVRNRNEARSGFSGFITTVRPGATSARPPYSITSVLSDSTVSSVHPTYSFRLARSTSSLTKPTPSFTSVRPTSSATITESTSSLTRPTPSFTSVRPTSSATITESTSSLTRPTPLFTSVRPTSSATTTESTSSLTRPTPLFTSVRPTSAATTMNSTSYQTTVRSASLDTSTKTKQGMNSTVKRPFHPAARIRYFKKQSETAVTPFLAAVTFIQPSTKSPLYTSHRQTSPFKRGAGRSSRAKIGRRNKLSTVFPKRNKIRSRTIKTQSSEVTPPLVTSPNATIIRVKAQGEGYPVIRKYRIPHRSSLPRKRIKQNSFRRWSGRTRKKTKHEHRECIYSLMNVEDVDKKLVQGNGVVVFS